MTKPLDHLQHDLRFVLRPAAEAPGNVAVGKDPFDGSESATRQLEHPAGVDVGGMNLDGHRAAVDVDALPHALRNPKYVLKSATEEGRWVKTIADLPDGRAGRA
jgi:hypothetical protein